MHKYSFVRILALALSLCLCLSACSGGDQLSSDDTSVILPEPAETSIQQILGDVSTADTEEVTLHFVSENSLSLSSATRTIKHKRGETLIESVLDEVLASASLSGAVEARVLHAEVGSGVVTVNLSIEASVNRSDQDYLLLCASIANTMLEIDGVEAVNVLTGDRSEPVASLPTGAFVESRDNIAAFYAQMQTEAERFLSQSGGSSISRNVLLYFPASGGRYMLPEVRELRFENADYLAPILEALSAGPLMRSCSFSAIPGEVELLEGEPKIYVNDSGERIVDLPFSSMLDNYLAFAGIENWQFYSSFVLTLCSFIPELDGVRFISDGTAIENCMLNGRNLHFENGVMRRSDFDEVIGSSSMLYFANGENALASIETPMARSAAESPRQLLEELILAGKKPPENMRSVFPAGIVPQDILGVHTQDRIAVVNLSANFYALCQNLNAAQERQLIYAMVNTLAELSGISAVSFRVEGRSVEKLAQNIYLRTALFPDLGLVSAVSPASEAANSDF